MKNSIEGFNQRNAVIMGLKSDDLLVLRWLTDFSHSPKMKKRMFGNSVYYWVNYKTILEDLPILDISKERLARGVFVRLIKAGVLKSRTVRERGKHGGVFSYYAFGESYNLLINDSEGEKKCENPENGSIPCVKNDNTLTSKMTQQRPCSYSNPSLKQENKATTPKDGVVEQEKSSNGVTDETKNSAEQGTGLKAFSAELQNFTDSVYPRLFKEYRGYEHPALMPWQRYRVLDILNSAMEDLGEDTTALEAAAEEFLSGGDCGDGDIRAFADEKVIDIRLTRLA